MFQIQVMDTLEGILKYMPQNSKHDLLLEKCYQLYPNTPPPNLLLFYIMWNLCRKFIKNSTKKFEEELTLAMLLRLNL